MFTFIGLECSTADRAGEFDLRTALNDSRCLRNLRMAVQAETDIFAWLIGRLNVMSLAVGFYRICRNTELFCDRIDRHTAFSQFGYDLFLLFRHFDHILVNKKKRAEERLCP